MAEALGATRPSKSQVPETAKELDGLVEPSRAWPLDQGPYRFLWAGALVVKVREGGRVVGAHVLIASGGGAEGHREVLGCEVTCFKPGNGRLSRRDPREAGAEMPRPADQGDQREAMPTSGL